MHRRLRGEGGVVVWGTAQAILEVFCYCRQTLDRCVTCLACHLWRKTQDSSARYSFFQVFCLFSAPKKGRRVLTAEVQRSTSTKVSPLVREARTEENLLGFLLCSRVCWRGRDRRKTLCPRYH